MKASAEILRNGTDYAAGWETGLNMGRERIGRKLFDREAPEHIRIMHRGDEWRRGYADGLIARHYGARAMVLYTNDSGRIVIENKTGTNNEIVNGIALRGIAGDVEITRNGKKHHCGI